MAKTYNLFISHSWSYSDQYHGLVNLLKQRPYFPWKDHSVPKTDPVHTSGTDRELADAIYRHMAGCHVVLILTGVYATYSKWIKTEIAIAQDSFGAPKPIVGIKPWASTQVSSVVSGSADKIVGWNTESIVGAIRELG